MKKEKVLKDAVSFGLATAEQVINELPGRDLERMGGLRGLLNRTKVNISDSLAKYGLADDAKKVANVDTNSLSNFCQFKVRLNSLA